MVDVGRQGVVIYTPDIKDDFFTQMPSDTEHDTTLQSALDNNEVIYHKTRIDFPFIQQSMQIKQVYNKTTGKVLCCEIPWDVARQRTGKDVYCKVGQCIMLWPDRSLDLYDTKLRWIRKICDVGTEFDIVWAQFWEYHGLRGEYTPDIKDDFSTQMPSDTDEHVVLKECTEYIGRVISKVSALNHKIRQHPGFVKNKWTECAEQCVAGFYTYHGVDKTCRGIYKPKKACTVEDSLRFIALDVKSNVLQMQRDVGGTIYKDDVEVRAALQELVDRIDEGFVYFTAGSAREYVGYVGEKLAKLYERVRGGRTETWWPGKLEQSVGSVNTLMQSVDEGDKTKATIDRVLENIAEQVEPTLLVLSENMMNTEYATDGNSKLLYSILEYIDRGIVDKWKPPTSGGTLPAQADMSILLRRVKVLSGC